MAANGQLAPPIATDVHEHTDEPRLFVRCALRHRVGRSSGPEERLLHEIPGILRASREPPRKPVQTLVMGLEEHPHPRRRVVH